MHFQGARKIIELRGGLGAVFKKSRFLKSQLTLFMMYERSTPVGATMHKMSELTVFLSSPRADVLSATTLGTLPASETARQLEYCDLIPDLLQDGLETCFLCPNMLFDAIIYINNLRAVPTFASITATIIPHRQGEHDSEGQMSRLLHNILSFSPSEWADHMFSHCSTPLTTTAATTKSHHGPSSQFLDPNWDDWFRIAHIYHAAVLLYFIRSLALTYTTPIRTSCTATSLPLQPSYENISTIQTWAKSSLWSHLRALFARDTQEQICFGKLVIWPLFVAGVEAAVSAYDGDFQEGKFVIDAFTRLGITLGAANLFHASEFLEGLCSKQKEEEGECCGPKWWNDVFSGVVKRAMFFM